MYFLVYIRLFKLPDGKPPSLPLQFCRSPAVLRSPLLSRWKPLVLPYQVFPAEHLPQPRPEGAIAPEFAGTESSCAAASMALTHDIHQPLSSLLPWAPVLATEPYSNHTSSFSSFWFLSRPTLPCGSPIRQLLGAHLGLLRGHPQPSLTATIPAGPGAVYTHRVEEGSSSGVGSSKHSSRLRVL